MGRNLVAEFVNSAEVLKAELQAERHQVSKLVKWPDVCRAMDWARCYDELEEFLQQHNYSQEILPLAATASDGGIMAWTLEEGAKPPEKFLAWYLFSEEQLSEATYETVSGSSLKAVKLLDGLWELTLSVPMDPYSPGQPYQGGAWKKFHGE